MASDEFQYFKHWVISLEHKESLVGCVFVCEVGSEIQFCVHLLGFALTFEI